MSLDWDDKAAVDAAVKAVIAVESANGATTRAGLILATIREEHGRDAADFRGVDSSLQRLRKRGEIVLKTGPGGGWLIAEARK